MEERRMYLPSKRRQILPDYTAQHPRIKYLLISVVDTGVKQPKHEAENPSSAEV
jgi:hypothetical protein